MNHSDDASIGDAIRRMLSDYKLDSKLNEVKLISRWKHVVGDMIDKHTENLYIKNKILYIKLDSPALKNELMYSRSKIIELLNKEAGLEVIKEVVFI